MQVTITSGGIQALCAVIALLAGAAVWAVKSLVAGEIRKLNGRYVYSAGSSLNGREIERRIINAEDDISDLQGRHGHAKSVTP